MITEELFKKRLIAFYSSWRTHKQLWGHSDIIVVSTPAQASNLSSSSSSSSRDFFLWLFEEDLAGSTAVFTPSSIFFLCPEKSFSGLRSLGSYVMGVMNIPVSVELLKPDDEGVSKLDEIIRCRRYRLFAAALICTLTVGCIDDEIPRWKLLLSCLNGYLYFCRFMIAGVSRGVRKLIVQQQQQMQCYNEAEEEFKLQLQLQIQLETAKRGGIRERLLSVPRQRLTFLYSSWRKYRKELWGDSHVLVVTIPPSSSSGSSMATHPVSCSFFLWLLGHEFPNTTVVFMDQAIYFYCPSESLTKLGILGAYLTTKEVPVSVQRPKKVDEDESEQLLNSLWRAATNDHPSSSSSSCVIIGYIDGEAPNYSKLVADEKRFQATNVISGFVKLLLNEEEGEGLLKSLQTPPQNYNKEDIAEKEQVMSLSLSNSNDAKAAAASSMVSNERQKDDDEQPPTSEEEEEAKQLVEEDEVNGKLPCKFAEIINNVFEGGAVATPTEEDDGSESKLLVAEQKEEEVGNSRCNAEQVLAEKGQDDGIQNSRNEESSVASDDDWEIIEGHHEEEGQEEPNHILANNTSTSWRSWISRR